MIFLQIKKLFFIKTLMIYVTNNKYKRHKNWEKIAELENKNTLNILIRN